MSCYYGSLQQCLTVCASRVRCRKRREIRLNLLLNTIRKPYPRNPSVPLLTPMRDPQWGYWESPHIRLGQREVSLTNGAIFCLTRLKHGCVFLCFYFVIIKMYRPSTVQLDRPLGIRRNGIRRNGAEPAGDGRHSGQWHLDASSSPLHSLHCRGVHGSGKSHGNPIPMGIPWEWE